MIEMKVPAENLTDIPFPDCAKDCAAVEYLGVGECEDVCPFKFSAKCDKCGCVGLYPYNEGDKCICGGTFRKILKKEKEKACRERRNQREKGKR